MAACSKAFPRDPAVVHLVEVIAAGEQSISWDANDVVVTPAALAELIRLGPAATPTLLDMLPTTTDSWTREMLFEALGHIRDPRAREPLERLLARPTREIPSGALPALVQLGQPQSIPALRALLARPDRGGFRQAELLAALLGVGDDSVLEPLIDRGLQAPDSLESFEAVEALEHHPPLRQALGMQEEPAMVTDDELFLRAAKEYLLEQRGEPSPWKAPRDFAFQEPFAAEKQQAFDLVAGTRNQLQDGVRFLPVDVALADTAPSQPFAVLFGWGHAQNLVLDVWQPRGGTVRLCRFATVQAAKLSTFECDDMHTEFDVAEVPMQKMQRLLAGTQAALSTRIARWWSGPFGPYWSSSNNFCVALMDASTPDQTPAFCGYESGTDQLRYATLAGARDWHLRMAHEATRRPTTAAEHDRLLFAELWLRSRERWNDEAWWWVRERMVTMAGAFGDASLIPRLREYLQPRFAEGEYSLSRTAAHACTSLAALTGTDLRFDTSGAARPVDAVARDYLVLLDRK